MQKNIPQIRNIAKSKNTPRIKNVPVDHTGRSLNEREEERKKVEEIIRKIESGEITDKSEIPTDYLRTKYFEIQIPEDYFQQRKLEKEALAQRALDEKAWNYLYKKMSGRKAPETDGNVIKRAQELLKENKQLAKEYKGQTWNIRNMYAKELARKEIEAREKGVQSYSYQGIPKSSYSYTPYIKDDKLELGYFKKDRVDRSMGMFNNNNNINNLKQSNSRELRNGNGMGNSGNSNDYNIKGYVKEKGKEYAKGYGEEISNWAIGTGKGIEKSRLLPNWGEYAQVRYTGVKDPRKEKEAKRRGIDREKLILDPDVQTATVTTGIGGATALYPPVGAWAYGASLGYGGYEY